MKINSDGLKRAYQAYISQGVTGPKKHCPSSKQLKKLLNRHLSQRKTLEIFDHLASCRTCAKDLMFIIEVERFSREVLCSYKCAAKLGKEYVESQRTAGTQLQGWQLSRFYIGLLCVIASLSLLIGQLKKLEIVRSAAARISVSQPVQKGNYVSSLLFRWQSDLECDYYVVELFTSSLVPLWKSPELKACQQYLPPEITRGLQVGKTYYWMVTAYRKRRVVAESSLNLFTFGRN
jgi:hypothetical protein